MKRDLIRIAALAAMAMLANTATADHNSKWGEGWAKMPNDIHKTRVETRGDNEAFREFVKNGGGAESENRFDTADDKGAASRAKAGGKSDQQAAKATSRDRDRTRQALRRNDRSAQATRSHTRAMRSSGGRGRR